MQKNKHVEAKKYPIKQPMCHWRSQRKFKKYPETSENVSIDPQTHRYGKSNSKQAVYSSISLPQETRKISNKQSKLAPIRIRKRKNRKSVAREEIIKSRAETNERLRNNKG